MAQVFVIGGANMDIKAKATGRHVAATSNLATISTKAGGVARNIAHNLARLGADVTLLTAVGTDSAGDELIKATAAAGVDVSPSRRENAATGTYIAFLDSQGELITAANDMSILKAITPQAVFAVADQIKQAKLIVADCNLQDETLEAVASLAAGRLVVEPVSVPKSQRLAGLLAKSGVFLATPNLDQIEALTQMRDIRMAAAQLHHMGLRNVVIHAAGAGAHVSDGAGLTHIPARAHSVIDVTGAGDAATAGLVYGLLQGLPIDKAAEQGQIMAAKVIASTASTLD